MHYSVQTDRIAETRWRWKVIRYRVGPRHGLSVVREGEAPSQEEAFRLGEEALRDCHRTLAEAS